MKIITTVLAIVFLTSCTTVKYNARPNYLKKVSYPEEGASVTVSIGERMVLKGNLVEQDFLVVYSYINGVLYDIPAKKYPKVGFDKKNNFYSSNGVIRAGLADPFKALSVSKSNTREVCVVTIFGATSCYEGDFEERKDISERGNSFQQTLLYNGRVGNKINIGYREFSNNTARPAFNNDVEYDLEQSSTIAYKGALIEVLKADNLSITYKLIKNFD